MSFVVLFLLAFVLGVIGARQQTRPSGLPVPEPEPEFDSPRLEFTPTAPPDDVPPPPALPSSGGGWVSQGPGPTNAGQAEGITNNPVAGAIQTIVAHPSNADILWIGAVNGGIWKTTNATAASPTWTAQSDTHGSLSIGALQRDPTDATSNTLVAGFGRFSSFSSNGGPRNGVLLTTDGGTNWTALASSGLAGKNVSGIAARGATIVVSVNLADSFTCGNIGIFRSVNTGASFSMISGGSGLPFGRAFDLASDPTNNAVLYTAVRDVGVCGSGGVNGVFKSVDTGATWTKVSSAAMEAMMTDAAGLGNTRFAVGQSGEVYAGLITNGTLAGLFRSATGDSAWTQLDTPTTNENGSTFGIQPTEQPGSQGTTHFSIVADPTNANIVYVGGDRQPGSGDGAASFPNSIGAVNYSGRLFRVNAAAGAGTQATPLTHCQAATAACNSTISTSSNSAPHADSRRMVFDAAGNLLESDDGGIYRRTNPRTTGDWFSVNGTLRVTEQHNVAYDTVSNMLISGNQDTGTSEQTSVGGTTWNQVSQGDGGDVSVDDIGSATQSIRYSSFQNLQSLRRRIVNASGVTTSTVFPARTVIGGGAAFSAQFVTPVEINWVDPTRVLFAGTNFLYESLDRGDTITALTGFNRTATAMVYGGKSGGVNNLDLIYAISTTGANVGGPNVFVRTSGSGSPTQTATSPGAAPATLRDIAVNPADWQNAFVVSSTGRVFSTINAGAAWTEITGDLANGTTDLRSIVFMSGTTNSLAVGGLNGVFVMSTGAAGVWKQLGTGLSNAQVWDLDYDATDDVLVAGTLGRASWKLGSASTALSPPTVTAITPASGRLSGGTSVTLTGTNFAAGATVSIGGVSATGVSVANSTTITATTGAHAAGLVDVVVTNADTQVGTLASGYRYIDRTLSGISPASGSTSGGTNVTITGSGLTDGTPSTTVVIGGVSATSVVVSAGGITATTGARAAGTVNVVVTFPDGQAPTLTNAFTYAVPNSAPTITAISDQTVNEDTATSALGFTVGDAETAAGSLTMGGASSNTTVVPNGNITFGGSGASRTVTVTPAANQSGSANITLTVTDGGGLTASTIFALTISAVNDAPTISTITNKGIRQDTATTAIAFTVGDVETAAGSLTVSGSSSATGLVPNANIVFGGSGASRTVTVTPVPGGSGTATITIAVSDGSLQATSAFVLTVVGFTDNVLAATVTPIKRVHIIELRTLIDELRVRLTLSEFPWTDGTITVGSTPVRRQHILDLRTALTAAYVQAEQEAPTFTDLTITTGVTPVTAAHIEEIRAAYIALLRSL